VTASGNAPAETLRFARLLIGEESYLPAEDILLAALRLNRSNVEILSTLGDLYLEMEDYGRAQSAADALRRLDGEEANQAANAIEAGRLNRQRGANEAMAYLESLSEAEDASLATRISLVQSRLVTGDIEGAIELAQQLKEEDPDNPVLNISLAVAHTANGDFDVAEALYTDLLEAKPTEANVWLALSRLKQRQEDREGAKAAIDQGLTHSPEAASLLWGKASFLEQDGEVDEAIDIYERLYAQDSSDIVVTNNLASLLATHRDDEASLERAWRIARRLRDAEAAPLQDTYGWILHRRGNSAEALPYLESAAEGLPNDPVVLFHLAQVYIALNRPEEALEQLRQTVTLAGPADSRPQIQQARSQIQELQNAETTEN
jgi:tetratricopeptide (TPR) repeat protein